MRWNFAAFARLHRPPRDASRTRRPPVRSAAPISGAEIKRYSAQLQQQQYAQPQARSDHEAQHPALPAPYPQTPRPYLSPGKPGGRPATGNWTPE